MYTIKTIEIQDGNENIYYPHTDSSVVKYNNTTVEDILDNLSNSGFYYCGTTAGTNDYTVTNSNINSYNGEFVVIIKIGVTNTGACTLKINDLEVKNILDNSGNAITAGTLKKDSMYQLLYNGTDFFILTNKGGGGGGNLVAKYLLTGYYGEGDNGRVDGTMIDRGAPTTTLNCGETYNINEGYYSGGKITINNLSNQTSGTATVDKILTGETAWVNGNKVTGNMANQGAKTSSLNCGGSYTIPKGYHNGSGKVTANSLASQMTNNGVTLTSANQLMNGVKAISKTGQLLTGTATITSLGGLVPKIGTVSTTTNSTWKYEKNDSSGNIESRSMRDFTLNNLGITPKYGILYSSLPSHTVGIIIDSKYYAMFGTANDGSKFWEFNRDNNTNFALNSNTINIPINWTDQAKDINYVILGT